VRVLELLGAWPAPLAIFLRTPEGQLLNQETRALIARGLGLLGSACISLGETGKGEEVLRLLLQRIEQRLGGRLDSWRKPDGRGRGRVTANANAIDATVARILLLTRCSVAVAPRDAEPVARLTRERRDRSVRAGHHALAITTPHTSSSLAGIFLGSHAPKSGGRYVPTT
jgi:hypothetical protein